MITLRTKRGLGHALIMACVALLAVAPLAAQYEAQGPAPLESGQIEGMAAQNNPVSGAIEAVAPHPTIADTLIVGGVNGGIWRTTNATNSAPSWTQVSDSGSIADIKYDLSDATSMTLLAGIGNTSSFAGVGSDLNGLLRSTNGGTSWSAITTLSSSPRVRGVEARGANLVATVRVSDPFLCSNIGVFHSSNTGGSFTQRLAGYSYDVTANPLTTGATTTEMFTSVDNAGACTETTGVYRSVDSGATWTKVSTATIDGQVGGASNVAISVGRQGVAGAANVYVGICTSGRLSNLWRSGDSGTSWSAMTIPATSTTTVQGIHPGGQCGLHLSLQADPSNHNVVYIGGDRQPDASEEGGVGQFPNSHGAGTYSGQVQRVDATSTLSNPLTHCTSAAPASCAAQSTTLNSAPHADSRDMGIDANGDLIESDDGGVFRRSNPIGVGDWTSVNGNIQVTEHHSAAYDTISNSILTGNQDNGSGFRQGGSLRAAGPWSAVSGGDGGDVGIGINDPVASQSTRYSSFQNIGAFARRVYNSSNVLQSTAFPARTVTGGCAAMGNQFVHPIRVNKVDPSRIVFGGSNGVYESTDRGDTITNIVNTGGCATPNTDTITQTQAFVYGYVGQGGTPNADFLAYGRTFDSAICVRTAAPPAAPVCVVPPGATGGPVAVAVDPGNALRLAAVTSTQIFESTNGGASWTDVTGGLPATAGPFHTATIIRNVAATHVALVIGARNGVFFDNDAATRAFGTYIPLSSGLPKAPVYKLDYDPADDRLLVGTLGAGSFTLENVNAMVPVELESFSVE